jgi:DNA-binding Lrp family transcriptional regulator
MSKKTLTARILEVIWENPGISIKEIAVYLGIPPTTTRAILYRLKNHGYIEKAGTGYVLTGKGEWFINNVLLGKREDKTGKKTSQEEENKQGIDKNKRIEEKNTVMIKKENIGVIEEKIANTKEIGISKKYIERIKVLEEKISVLESSIKKLYEEVESIKEKLDKIMSLEKKQTQQIKMRTEVKAKPRKSEGLPEPIMHLRDARRVIGLDLDTLIRSGRVVVIGTLVVDSEFYEEFKKRFPMSIRDAEKLSYMERRLLEEMNREAIVIIRAGKYYDLIK